MEIKIFDNFLKKEDLEILENLDFPFVKFDELKIFKVKFLKTFIFSSEFLPEKILKDLMKIIIIKLLIC